MRLPVAAFRSAHNRVRYPHRAVIRLRSSLSTQNASSTRRYGPCHLRYSSGTSPLIRRCSVSSKTTTDAAPEETETKYAPEYQYIESVENLHNYCPGGLPIVQVGDLLDHGRYEIVHKLGHGGSSTIWLARDSETTELVAIKACTHQSSERSREAEYMSLFSENRLVRRLLRCFTMDGVNGIHICLVMEPALCSLAAAKEASYHQLLPLPLARTIIADLIHTIQSFHKQGVAHGDIHVGNILLRLPESFKTLSNNALYEEYGHPIQHPIVRIDGEALSPNTPSIVYWPAWLNVSSDEIPKDCLPIMISDFGEAFRPSTAERRHAYTLPALTPPESLLAEEIKPEYMSFSSEIWTLGCTIFELLGNRFPFDPWDSSRDEILCEHVSVLGKLPERFWTCWSERDKYYDEDGTHDIQGDQPKLLNDGLNERYEWCIASPRRRQKMKVPDEEEKRAFLDMISMMLVLDPTQRASIGDIAHAEWVQKWAHTSKEGANGS